MGVSTQMVGFPPKSSILNRDLSKKKIINFGGFTPYFWFQHALYKR